MKGVEEVFFKKELIAVVYRKNIAVEGVTFLTNELNPFQVGLHSRQKGIKLMPHVHKLDRDLIIKSIQEVLYLVKGKIKVTLFTKSGIKIAEKILVAGDSVLLVSGGHGVDFLEDSRILEIKQGPYPGAVNAKKYLTSKE